MKGTLSDKIDIFGKTIPVKDVREFVKKLKEYISGYMEDGEWKELERYIDDEIFGEKLI